MFCKVNLTHPSSKGYNASNIDFIFTKAAIPRDQIEKNVINETTAVIRVRNMNASNPFLQCVLKRPSGKIQLVCQNQIDVGCKWSFVWIFLYCFSPFLFQFSSTPSRISTVLSSISFFTLLSFPTLWISDRPIYYHY